MYHSFNTELAEKYGILEAVLINNIMFWVEKNKANGEHFYDGRYWTYNSVKAFEDLFPYASGRQIRYALDHLRNEGILITGNYNKSSYDRTLWYAFSDYGVSVVYGESSCQVPQMDLTDLSNRSPEIVEPIPYINTDIKQDINNSVGFGSDSSKPDGSTKQNKPVSEIIEYLNTVCHTNFKSSSSKTRRLVGARLNEGFTIDDFKAVIDYKYKAWGLRPQMFSNGVMSSVYLRPETLFSGKFESYLNEAKINNGNPPIVNDKQKFSAETEMPSAERIEELRKELFNE
jgi:uncharacterized phage protein (TIGR02220 family)